MHDLIMRVIIIQSG